MECRHILKLAVKVALWCFLAVASFGERFLPNDLLGRRTSKNTEQYGYNVRDELISADEVSYAYDDIGINVLTSTSEVGNRTTVKTVAVFIGAK